MIDFTLADMNNKPGKVTFAQFRPGMRKLIALEPLKKLVPLDIFLPIAYGKYHYKDGHLVNRHFEPRNLIALAAKQPICHPAQYWVDKHHISDTGIVRKSTGVINVMFHLAF